jgi:hypothetical protein
MKLNFAIDTITIEILSEPERPSETPPKPEDYGLEKNENEGIETVDIPNKPVQENDELLLDFLERVAKYKQDLDKYQTYINNLMRYQEALSISNTLRNSPTAEQRNKIFQKYYNKLDEIKKKQKLFNLPRTIKHCKGRNGLITYRPDETVKGELPSFNTLVIDFPSDFLASQNRKFIEIMSAICIQYPVEIVDNKYVRIEGQENKIDRGLVICSDLIQDNPYGDSLLTLANEDYNIGKKIEVLQIIPQFFIWVKNQDGDIINLHPFMTRLILQFELTY